MRLILVRHGESRCNKEGIVGGIKGCTGLTELGWQQAMTTARYLESYLDKGEGVLLCSSVLPRAIETAQVISAELGVPLSITHCGLCELHVGQADGMTWEQYAQTFGVFDLGEYPFRPVAPGGESWAQFLLRAVYSLDEIAKEFDGKYLVVATHGGVIQATIIRWLCLPHYGTRAGLRPEYASVTEWGGSPGAWRLIRYNFLP